MTYDPPDEVGESHPKISDAKNYLKRFSYGKMEGLGDTDTSDLITPGFARAFRQYRNNVHFDFLKGRRPTGMPDLDPNNYDFDWAAQKNMGLLASTVPPPRVKPYYGLSWTGTWGAWDNGFGYDTLRRADQNKIDVQGLGYNTGAFLSPDPSHSYLDMINDGVAEGNRWALPDRRRKVLAGYSGGAGCVVEFLRRWPADRRNEIALILQYGDPNRPPGRTLLGNDPGGHGISEDFPPDWCLDRYYSFTIDGDMYPNAVGLLPIFYDILTRLEATPEFMMWFFNLLVDQLGSLTPIGGLMLGTAGSAGIPFFGQLASMLPMLTGGLGMGGAAEPKINLISMLFNIPAIIGSLMAALKFLITNAHTHYGDQPVFDGLTGVDKGAQLINALP